MLNVLEQEEQKALVTRCHMEGIYIVSTENSLQFPINAILDILKPFLKINQLEIIKKKLQLLMSKLTNKRYLQGMKKGYPDLFIPEYKLYIELKRRDGGVVSAEQLVCHEKLRSFGYRVEVCHGVAECWRVICEVRDGKSHN